MLANAAIVPAGTNGAVSFFAANPTDLIVDINGYFAPPGTGGLNFYTATARARRGRSRYHKARADCWPPRRRIR